MVEIIKLDFAQPVHAFIRCREVIKAGGVIAYPTDTFYGLGVDPRNQAAVRRLFDIKGRQTGQPILLLIKSSAEVKVWAANVTPAAEELMKNFWPGPLTLVFSAKQGVLAELTGATGTIGLRVPGNELTRKLLEFLGTALTGTSANSSGGPEPRTARDVADDIGGRIDLVLDAGMAAGGRPSTILDVSNGPPKVIRAGAVKIK